MTFFSFYNHWFLGLISFLSLNKLQRKPSLVARIFLWTYIFSEKFINNSPNLWTICFLIRFTGWWCRRRKTNTINQWKRITSLKSLKMDRYRNQSYKSSYILFYTSIGSHLELNEHIVRNLECSSSGETSRWDLVSRPQSLSRCRPRRVLAESRLFGWERNRPRNSAESANRP